MSPKTPYEHKPRKLDEEGIAKEIEEYRRRKDAKIQRINLSYLDRPDIRLVEPGDYGPIHLEHEFETPDDVNYVLTGSSMTRNSKFPRHVPWVNALTGYEDAYHDRKKGKIVIPVFHQVSANIIHAGLLPILASALASLKDPLQWPYPPSMHINIEYMPDGTGVLESTKYGAIALVHALSGTAKTLNRSIVYKLRGRKTKGNRFPGVPDWNRMLKESGIATHIRSSQIWTIRLETPELAKQANQLLIPLFKEAILMEHSFKTERRTAHVLNNIRATLEFNGVDPDSL
ncbi:hypothetical protein [Thiolapillus sp.]|uniref:hypothetical protein n=2 Tax=Thiolapillus sp. TaxID=2017437 RepID=UPI003AF4929D